MKTRSYLSSILHLQCPSCRSSHLFTDPTLFGFKYEMKKECSHCGVDYEPEPGFYYGAMFISYIGSAFTLLICTFIMVFGLGWSLSMSMGILLTILLLMHAYLFKISRSIWVHWFVKYDPSKAIS